MVIMAKWLNETWTWNLKNNWSVDLTLDIRNWKLKIGNFDMGGLQINKI